MAGLAIDANLLKGLSLAEAFSKFVLNDPAVVSLAALVLRRDKSHAGVFRDGQYPGLYVDYAWPLDITANDLAFEFVKPTAFYMEDAAPVVVPKDILDVSEILVGRIGAIKDLLTSGSVVARGTFTKTGIVNDVARLQWARRGISVDVQNGDLLDTKGREPVVMWSGLVLHRPVTAAFDEHLIDAKPSVGGKGKDTAHRASIAAAIAALWSGTVPRGLTVNDRDGQINDWQRAKGWVVTSAKTIKRYLDGE